MVLLVSTAVSIAGIQSGPLVVGSKATIRAGERVVENGASGHEGNGTH